MTAHSTPLRFLLDTASADGTPPPTSSLRCANISWPAAPISSPGWRPSRITPSPATIRRPASPTRLPARWACSALRRPARGTQRWRRGSPSRASVRGVRDDDVEVPCPLSPAADPTSLTASATKLTFFGWIFAGSRESCGKLPRNWAVRSSGVAFLLLRISTTPARNAAVSNWGYGLCFFFVFPRNPFCWALFRPLP